MYAVTLRGLYRKQQKELRVQFYMQNDLEVILHVSEGVKRETSKVPLWQKG